MRGNRVNGPYQHRNHWRVRITASSGACEYHSFATRAEAEAFATAARDEIATLTASAAMERYLEHLATFGGSRSTQPVRASTLVTVRHKLSAILGLRAGDYPLSDLTPGKCARLYEARTRDVRPDTHRGELITLQAFGDWLVASKLTRTNPAAGVRPRGALSAGKAILYTDDAARLFQVANDGTPEGLAVVTVLVCGLRAGELLGLTCRDLDAGGTILRVAHSTEGKNRRARRNIAVPDVLQPALRALRGDRLPGEPLWPTLNRFSLRKLVASYCKRAGVPVVTTHGLRGTALTEAAKASLAVAQQLAGHRPGHRVTVDHYVAPGTLESTRAAEIARVVTEREPDPSPAVPTEWN